MQREIISARPEWAKKVESVGLTYHSDGMPPGEIPGVFWDEKVCYSFSLSEVEVIEAATEELHRLCLKAVEYVVDHPELMDKFNISEGYRNYIIRSWRRNDPYVMGRFDLAFDPTTSAVKMLEYNADTPTLVIETALVQWFWLQEKFPTNDQFNSLHEKLIEQYRKIATKMGAGSTMVFSSLPPLPTGDYACSSIEEYAHIEYFMELARQAGMSSTYCAIQDIGWEPQKKTFVDLDCTSIKFWSKIYPWEWLESEGFGVHLPEDTMGVVEPVWKMLLSNKAILPILWQLFPNHPNLLPAFWDKNNMSDYVTKPTLAREGANIEIVEHGTSKAKTDGSYGDNPLIYQGLVELPRFDGQYVVLGSWMVGDAAAGMIVRESESPIVVSESRVVPHYISG